MKKYSTLLLAVIYASTLLGATFTVTNLNDSGTGSLRQAIIESNNNGSTSSDTININVTGTILFSTANTTDINILPLLENVTLNGNGIILKTSLNGRFFQINNCHLVDVILDGGRAGLTGGTVLISGTSSLTRVLMINGFAGTFGTNSQGGGARCNFGSNVTMTDCTLRNNEATNGAAISVNSGATLTLNRCIVSDNTVSSPGITASAIYLQGALNMTNCIIANTNPSPMTPDLYDLGMTILTNVNNLVENYVLAPGGTPPPNAFTSTADPQLVPESSNPYYLFMVSPTSPLPSAGPRFAPGGAAITSVNIPTLSQWGMMILGIALLTMGLVAMYNIQMRSKWSLANNVYIDGCSSSGFNFESIHIPFDRDIFMQMMKWSVLCAAIGFGLIYIIWGEIIPADIVGMSVSVPLVSYLLYLLKKL